MRTSFTGHATEFAGLPVFGLSQSWTDEPPRLVPEAELPTEPGAVAWRIEAWEDDDGWDYGPSSMFRHAFEQFLELVDPAGVRALVIGSWGYAAMNAAPIGQLCAAADRLTGLRALFLGDIPAEECELSWICQGDVAALLAAYPGLEILRIRSGDADAAGRNGLAFDAVRHGALRTLVVESAGLSAGVVRGIADSDFPALAHLELWLGTDRWGGDTSVEDLAPILGGERLPSLRSLGLRNAEIADRVAVAVAGAPVVARLRELDLSLGVLSDEGAAALLAGQPLTHLRRLDLHHHYLSAEMADRLVAELPGVEVDLTEVMLPDEYDDRYVAVDE
ncbi:STM4015 family protein [Plantactinospora sp. B6F1]|uniref:STM4015 family protein n=1 Tax=Plantactinospora sp. B6F1 TaxID=3158971 RepID=UPI00102C672D